jgi:LmbE family N-acetylglucosaminyl deacetylase
LSAFDLDPNLRWLFCMTHPDDEISICAFVRRLVLNGNQVFISWTHSKPVREREARKVAKLLGVPQTHLRFFHATDGQVCHEIPELLSQFRSLVKEVGPDRICCGAFEQGHIDHDATNFLVSHSFDGPIYEIPFYHTYLTRLQILNRFSDGIGQEILPLTEPEQEFKLSVARSYPSQNIWRILLLYELSHKMLGRRKLLMKTERMRLQSHFNYRRPNHPPKLARRVKNCETWKRWKSAVRMAYRDIEGLRAPDYIRSVQDQV